MPHTQPNAQQHARGALGLLSHVTDLCLSSPVGDFSHKASRTVWEKSGPFWVILGFLYKITLFPENSLKAVPCNYSTLVEVVLCGWPSPLSLSLLGALFLFSEISVAVSPLALGTPGHPELNTPPQLHLWADPPTKNYFMAPGQPPNCGIPRPGVQNSSLILGASSVPATRAPCLPLVSAPCLLYAVSGVSPSPIAVGQASCKAHF